MNFTLFVVLFFTLFLVIWTVVRFRLKYEMFLLLNSGKDLNDFFMWWKHQPKNVFDFFNVTRLKHDLEMRKQLYALAEVDVDDILPTTEHLEEVVATIIEEFSKEVRRDTKYFDESINPLWALIKIMSPPDNEVVSPVLAHLDKIDLINLSKTYCHIRDEVTRTSNLKSRAKMDGYFYDAPVYHQVRKQLRLETHTTPNDVKLYYIRDLTNPIAR